MDLTLFVSPEHRQDEDFTHCFDQHIEQVELARDLGYDGVAIGSHLCYSDAAWFPPLESLMRLAAVADGMTLSTCMLVLPLHHPLLVAQQAALLDTVCGGNFILGVSQGWQEEEFRLVGIDFHERLGRFREGVTLIQRLWTEDAVDFSGKYFSYEKLSLMLKPARKPRPPMWFGGSVEKAVARAATLADTALGDSWVASSHLTEEVITAQAQVFRGRLQELGKPMPREFPLLRNIVVAPDKETAIREAGPFIADSYRIFGEWGLFTNVVGSGKEQLEFEELLAGRVIIGSPEDCAEEIVRLAKATGCTRFVARNQWYGMDQRTTLRTIELLATEVKPLVDKALAA